MREAIKSILEKELPKGFNIIVEHRKNFYGGDYLMIAFSPNKVEIHRVGGQYPQVVSLMLDLDNMGLEGQVFGGNGGLRIYREPDLNHPREKYLAMVGVKVPFRRPQRTEKAVLKAVEGFARNYLKTLKENKDTLRYKDIVDYSFLN